MSRFGELEMHKLANDSLYADGISWHGAMEYCRERVS